MKEARLIFKPLTRLFILLVFFSAPAFASAATIYVNQIGATGSFVINPGGHTTSPATVSPGSGTVYQITATPPAGYMVSSISNSLGGTDSMTLIDGDTQSFTINYQSTNLPATPVIAYGFDEGAGVVAEDASLNNYDGALVGGAGWTIGKYGKAVDLFGGDERVTSVDVDYSVPPFTITAWFKGVGFIVSKTPSAGSEAYNVWTDSSSIHTTLLDSNGLDSSVTNQNYNDGNWHHYALVVTNTPSNKFQVYIDGVIKGSDGNVPPLFTNSSPITIGGLPYLSSYFTGAIDEFRLYNVALSASEVAQDRDNATPIPQATISVNSEDLTGAPLASNWEVSPGGGSTGGVPATNGTYVAYPNGATVYNISTGAPPTGYVLDQITNTLGGSSSMTLSSGMSEGFTVIYRAIASGDYTLSNNGAVTITKNIIPVSGQSIITKVPTPGPVGPITITATGYPGTGVAVTYSNRDCEPDCQSTITFTVDSTAPSGSSNILVTGVPGNVTTSFVLNINEPTSHQVGCSVAPPSVKVGEIVTWSAATYGGTGPFTFSWFGTDIPTSPAPSSNPYTITYETTGVKEANVTVTDTSNNETATCSGAPYTVNVSLDPRYEDF